MNKKKIQTLIDKAEKIKEIVGTERFNERVLTLNTLCILLHVLLEDE